MYRNSVEKDLASTFLNSVNLRKDNLKMQFLATPMNMLSQEVLRETQMA